MALFLFSLLTARTNYLFHSFFLFQRDEIHTSQEWESRRTTEASESAANDDREEPHTKRHQQHTRKLIFQPKKINILWDIFFVSSFSFHILLLLEDKKFKIRISTNERQRTATEEWKWSFEWSCEDEIYSSEDFSFFFCFSFSSPFHPIIYNLWRLALALVHSKLIDLVSIREQARNCFGGWIQSFYTLTGWGLWNPVWSRQIDIMLRIEFI